MPEPNTYHLGLIGWPVKHSFSPALHQAALEHCGLQGEYRLFPIAPLPDGRQALVDLLQQVRAGALQGFNVTIPHKQNVMPLLDEISPAAQAIGAVNTISLQNGNLYGDNTDAPGFINDLRRFLQAKQHQSSERIALVLGGGGSARAICYALQADGWQVRVATRRLSQAETLVTELQLHQALELTTDALSQQQPGLIVNTTPLGMQPHARLSPWPDEIPLPAPAAIYDLVYNPSETVLVHKARQAGLPAITGSGMLVEQALLAFRIWSGRDVPRQVMVDALVPELS